VDLLVVTDNAAVMRAFRLSPAPRQVPLAHLPRLLRERHPASGGRLVYLDRCGLGGPEELLRLAYRFRRRKDTWLAVLDLQAQVSDPARLFHLGLVDYAGPGCLETGITARRIRQVAGYIRRTRAGEEAPPAAAAPEREPEREAKAAAESPAAERWRGIVPGREHLFGIMFVELDGKEELQKFYDRRNLILAVSFFRRFVAQSVAPFDGRIWIWSRFGGIVLFPAPDTCSGFVECGFRLVLFRELHDVEGSLFRSAVSFRLILHVGRLTYSVENPGNVVSDTLNTTFHIGQGFARPGHCYLTQEVVPCIPTGLRDFFIPDGEYEGRSIYRMKDLNRGHPARSA
jgi:hypothetical protein